LSALEKISAKGGSPIQGEQKIHCHGIHAVVYCIKSAIDFSQITISKSIIEKKHLPRNTIYLSKNTVFEILGKPFSSWLSGTTKDRGNELQSAKFFL